MHVVAAGREGEVLKHVCLLERGIESIMEGLAMHPAYSVHDSAISNAGGPLEVLLVPMHPCSSQVLLLSTGVIGRRIKLDALLASLPQLVAGLGSSAEDAHHAAVAVTTTDLVSKSAALEVRCGSPKNNPIPKPYPVHHAAVAVTTTDLVSESAALEVRCGKTLNHSHEHHAAVAATTTDLVSKSAALKVRPACLFHASCLGEERRLFMIHPEPSMPSWMQPNEL